MASKSAPSGKCIGLSPVLILCLPFASAASVHPKIHCLHYFVWAMVDPFYFWCTYMRRVAIGFCFFFFLLFCSWVRGGAAWSMPHGYHLEWSTLLRNNYQQTLHETILPDLYFRFGVYFGFHYFLSILSGAMRPQFSWKIPYKYYLSDCLLKNYKLHPNVGK